MHPINEWLAVGNAEDVANPHARFTVVLNVASENKIASLDGRLYRWIPFKEFTEADPVQLDDAVAWLEQQERGSRLLVCCRAGIGRSSSVVIAYLCLTQGLSYQEAVTLVSARRPGATPLPNLEATIQTVRMIRDKRNGKARHA